jgi:hypothetical protein
MCRTARIDWALPKFLDPEILKPLLEYAPSDLPEELTGQMHAYDLDIPREMSRQVTTEIARFKNDALDVYRRNAIALDNAHQLLAHSTELRFGTLEAMADKLIGQNERLSDEAIYAVRKAILRQPVHFGEFFGGRRRGLFRIRPQRQIALITLVSAWLRQYRDGLATDPEHNVYEASRHRSREGFIYFDQFIKHARELIKQSRESRMLTPTGLSPSPHRSPYVRPVSRKNGTFSPQESTIIRYLELWCVQRAFSQDPGLFGLPSLVLKSIGMYDEYPPNVQTGVFLLRELGVLPPHTSKWMFSEELLLPCSGASKSLAGAYAKVHDEDRPIPLEDSMEHYRHDWGNLRVFCVDPPGSLDADDGISLEQVPGQPGVHWLRVHIANPSAFLKRDSLAADLAQQLNSKYYFPDVQFPMLPDNLTEFCSIKQGQTPVLTVSVKVDLEGNILDKDIRSAIIRNVKNTTYGNVDLHLGLDDGPTSIFTVGAEDETYVPEARPENAEIKPEDLETLRDILKITTAFGKRRVQMSFPDHLFGNAMDGSLTIWDLGSFQKGGAARLGKFHLPNRRMSCDFQGDPVIQLATSSYMPRILEAASQQRQPSSQNLVAESMIMANIALAEWSRERNIPLLYRGSLLRKPLSEVEAFKQQTARQVAALDESQVWEKVSLLQREARLIGSSFCSSRPTILPRVGAHAYVKGTSPLRRYGDLVTHWQVQAALRHEAETGRSLAAAAADEPPAGVLPFSRAEVDRMLLRVTNGELVGGFFEGLVRMHWYAEFFRRALYHGECALPATVRLLVLRTSEGARKVSAARPDAVLAHAWMLDHGLPISVSEADPLAVESGLRHYDVWEARIVRVVPGSGAVVAELVRLESRREEGFLEEHRRWTNYLHSEESYVPPFSDESSWGLGA